MSLSQEKSLILQALATTSLLAGLSNSEFLNSDCFNDMKFENESFKEILKMSGIGNPATMQMFLYALLVIPKEILTDSIYAGISKRFYEANKYIDELVEKDETTSTYEDDKKLIDYIYHIRNAVAHSRCTYETRGGKNYAIFYDEKNSDEKCTIVIECFKVGVICEKLQSILLDFYK